MSDKTDINSPLDAVAVKIDAKFTDWSAKRQTQEDQMIRDSLQYDGKDPEGTVYTGSTIFVNNTRPKVDYVSSRCIDTLIPADGSPHWNIANTPVPEISEAMKQAKDEFEALKAEHGQAAQAAEAGNEQAAQAAQQIEARLDDISEIYGQFKNDSDMLNKTCDNMRAEMDDQLKRCLYQSAVMKTIRQGFKLGAGVIKGPVNSSMPKKNWKSVEVQNGDGSTKTIQELQNSADKEPSFTSVDLWHFYPDPSALNGDEFFDVIQLHLLNKDGVRKLSKRAGFDKDAIRHVLETNSTEQVPNFVTRLNAVNNNKAELNEKYYQVLEYTGCLEYEDFKQLAESTGQEGIVDEKEDPLKAYYGVVWVCQGKVLSFSMFPYDREEQIYHVYTPIPVEGQLIGRSMTSILSHSQAMLNSSARALLDNGGITVGPQWLIAKGAVEHQNGVPVIEPNGIWIVNEDYMGNQPPIQAIHVDSRQSELAANMAIAQAHMDKESAIPEQATGEGSGSINQTAMGTAILTSQSLIRYKMYITLFDQQITVPNIRGLYDWNMQFNDKENIKGDMEVVATGASSLLVRELQANSLMTLAMQLSTHPRFGPMIKDKDLLKKVLSAHSIPIGDVMLSDAEIDAAIAAAQQPPEEAAPPADPMLDLKQDEMQLKLAVENAKLQSVRDKMVHEKEQSLIVRETEMIKIASNANIDIEKIAMKLEGDREKEMSKTRAEAQKAENTQLQIMSEAQVALETGVHAGGLV